METETTFFASYEAGISAETPGTGAENSDSPAGLSDWSLRSGADPLAILRRAYHGGELVYLLFRTPAGEDPSDGIRAFLPEAPNKPSYAVSITEIRLSGEHTYSESAGFTEDYAAALDTLILLFRESVFPCHLHEIVDTLISPDSPAPLSFLS